ncbi:hypothetical protein AB205_0050890 [Aquarana catesbeiana]|nr:hypothetical protein AB205_0050890 [Aquarana catesbeiana]
MLTQLAAEPRTVHHLLEQNPTRKLQCQQSKGAFVKIRDKPRHPECYVCTDCGTNLKQKGHFFVEEKMYCEKHARERMTPPEGYDVVTVFPK